MNQNGLLEADMNDQETKSDKCPACRGTGSAPILQPVQPLGTFGKPGQAVDTTPNQQPKQVLEVRWMPPRADDRSKCVDLAPGE